MSLLKRIAYAGIVGLAAACASCNSYGIRNRIGSPPNHWTAPFPNPSNLGKHNSSERNGQIYTAKAGPIDTDHLRKGADFTRAFSEELFDNLMEKKKEFSMKMREPSTYFIELDYPDYWENLPKSEKEKIARDVSISLGSYITYAGTTWHEVVTWFGWKSTVIIPEFESAFSCEDNFSNLLGVCLAEKVLRENKTDFNSGLTMALNDELKKLDIQPRDIARKAAQNMGTEKRHFDIGLDDGYITPWIVPGISNGVKVESYAIPNLDTLSKYGFSMKFEIEPREWEKREILKAAGKEKRIEVWKDFHPLMEYVRKDAVRRFGVNVNNPNVE